jgi:hypothetical protein
MTEEGMECWAKLPSLLLVGSPLIRGKDKATPEVLDREYWNWQISFEAAPDFLDTPTCPAAAGMGRPSLKAKVLPCRVPPHAGPLQSAAILGASEVAVLARTAFQRDWRAQFTQRCQWDFTAILANMKRMQ